MRYQMNMAASRRHFTAAAVFAGVILILVPTVIGSLKLGAFNIRSFGVTKAGKPDVMSTIAKIVDRYDIILIQEIRDASGDAIKDLLELVNSQTHHPFSMTTSPRLGRTIYYKEQYAYFYRMDSGLTLTHTLLFDDGDEALNTNTTIVDTFEREPYIVVFSCSTTVLKEFALVGIHIDPDVVPQELSALVNVIADVRNPSIMGIDDVMIMGDMNADCAYFPESEWGIDIKTDTVTYQWLIDDDVDTTVATSASSGDCAYDRFISTGSGFLATAAGGVVPDSAQVFRFDLEYGLTLDEANAVSDHYPIEFELKTDVTTLPPTTTTARTTTIQLRTTTVGPRQVISIASVIVKVQGPRLEQTDDSGNPVDYFMSDFVVTDIAGLVVGELYTGDKKSKTLKGVLDDMIVQGLCGWPMTVRADKRKYRRKRKCTLSFDVAFSDVVSVSADMAPIADYYVITGL